MTSISRYLAGFSVTVVAGLVICVALNVLVDPYAVFGSPTYSGLNEKKTRAGERAAVSKLHTISRRAFAGLILGNSRAALGLDPENAHWPNAVRPVYNAALPGNNLTMAERILRYALERGGIRHVIIGVDFFDFLGEPTSFMGDGVAQPMLSFRKRWLDRYRATFTLQASLDSIHTILSQRNPYATELTKAGFNPMRDYLAIAKRDGYYAMFRQRIVEHLKNNQQGLKSIANKGSAFTDQLRTLQRMRDQCVSHNVQCDFILYPYHAQILVLLEQTGLWSEFWNWKEMVRQIVMLPGGGDKSPRLLDFSNPSHYSTEPVPQPDDRTTITQWYWEAGHFKKELGDLMIARISGIDNSNNAELFGVDLRAADLRTHRVLAEARMRRYCDEHTREVRELKVMFAGRQLDLARPLPSAVGCFPLP